MRRHPKDMVGALLVTVVVSAIACGTEDAPRQSAEASPTEALDPEALLIARAAEFEMDTPWEVPPGDPFEHSTAGFAKVLCSAVFVTGRDWREAAETAGYFVSKPEERYVVTDTVVDMEQQVVHLTMENGVTRSAKFYGDQGCVTWPAGEEGVHFTPVAVETTLPDAATTPWPMGDLLPDEPLPADVDADLVHQAVEAAFADPEGLTAAFVVTHRGRIIGERYMEGMDLNTHLASWSMGKSLTGTLMGRLIQQGEYELWQPALVDTWYETPDDPRQNIRIGDIMQMSSGIRFVAPQDPEYEYELGYPAGYPDHIYVYTGAIDAFEWVTTRPPQRPPNTVGRYRNSDPLITNYLIRKAVEARGEEYLTFPQRALFDKIGIRKMVLETDPYGNFLIQGYEFGAGRDWARLGNLYLQDGVWNGERLLPEGYVEYASTLAPSWVADGRLQYGGAFFWINGEGQFPVPLDAYFMAGAGGQNTIIIPSHEMVVVRLGHYKGSGPGRDALENALTMLMQAVPSVAQ